MSAVPRAPKIYHITHVRNLRSIAATGHLVSDQRIAESEVSHVSVGMAHIKERRQRRSKKIHIAFPEEQERKIPSRDSPGGVESGYFNLTP